MNKHKSDMLTFRIVLIGWVVAWCGLSAQGMPGGGRDHSGGRAIVFWHRVNGSEPNSDYDYNWQATAENLGSKIEKHPEEAAAPFGIMARDQRCPDALADDLDTYLRNCREQGKTPFIVLSPQLNIIGYLATLFPLPIGWPYWSAQITVRNDLRWAREVTPIVMAALSRHGYASIDGYKHSWGGSTGAAGIEAAAASGDLDGMKLDIRAINTRVPRNQVNRINELPEVTVRVITTTGDAWTYPGSSAFGKGDVLIINASNPDGTPSDSFGWRVNQVTRHGGPLDAPPGTILKVERDGKRYETTLGALLRGPGAGGEPELLSQVAPIPPPGERESDWSLPESRRRQSDWSMPDRKR